MIRPMEMLNRLNDYDRQLFAIVFKQHERRALILLSRVLSRSGEGILHLLIPAVAWLLGLPETGELFALILLSFALERCLHWILKNTLQRPRPQHAIPGLRSLATASNQFSFPSGHSSRAFLLATVLAVIFGEPAVAMYLWAGTVALSRVLLGVHYPGDVLAGAVIGSGIVIFTAMLLGLA